MRNSFLLFLLFLSSSSGYSQKKSEFLKDTIVWNENYRLVKKDFEAKPRKGSYYGMTASGIMFNTNQENENLNFIVQAVFFQANSWLKTDSEYGLNHEQKHFDICEIYARKLRQKITTKHFSNLKKAMSEVAVLYKQVNAELQKEQDRYDDQTEHSIKTEKQEFWDKKIVSELEELKEFSATEVSLRVK